jgi:hypothetical protein
MGPGIRRTPARSLTIRALDEEKAVKGIVGHDLIHLLYKFPLGDDEAEKRSKATKHIGRSNLLLWRKQTRMALGGRGDHGWKWGIEQLILLLWNAFIHSFHCELISPEWPLMLRNIDHSSPSSIDQTG